MKNHKSKIVNCILAMIFSFSFLHAQHCEIPLIPFVPERLEPLPADSRSHLETKLTQIATRNGVAGVGYGQFYLTSKVALLSKDVMPGTRPMISQRLQTSLFIVDNFGNKVIASASFEIQAAGANENAAYMNAIRNINPSSAVVQNFIKQGKEKILDYYNANYMTIIEKAQSLSEMKQYEEALYLLTSIPECSDGYDIAIHACRKLYQAYIDDRCQRSLMHARTAWAASPNAAGAADAGRYLSEIEPAAACYKDAIALHDEIKSSVKEEWAFEFKNYDERALEKQRIEASREVGVEWAKGQQPSTKNIETIF